MLRNVSWVIASQGLLAAALIAPSPAARLAGASWVLSQAVLVGALVRPRSRLLATNTWRGDPRPRVALTFDDGPHPDDTPAILDILASAGVRATFFFVGERARRHPDLVRRAAREGHTIGVHSESHPWWFSLAGPARLGREVSGAAKTIAGITGRLPRHYRPPMGHKNLFLDGALRDAGLEQITWSARAYDTLGRSAGAIRRTLLRRARPGGILLMHEAVRRPLGAPSPTVAALPGLIAGLRARGLDPVSLEDLRSDPAMADRPPARFASS